MAQGNLPLTYAWARPGALMGVKSLLEKIPISRTTLHVWMYKGVIVAPKKFDGKLFWLETDIENFINSIPDRAKSQVN